MKKGPGVILIVLICGICMVIGIFIGRNHREVYLPLSPNFLFPAANAPRETTDVLLDINTASKAQLMELPGIGEEIAGRIIRYRTENGPFESVEDLLFVKGIGKDTLFELDGLIKVGG